MRSLRLFAAGVTGAVVLAGLVATAAGLDRTSVTGGGTADVTDVDGNVFPRAGQFSLAAGLTADGSPYGHISFVFRGEFAGYWGALPGVTDAFRLTGTVQGVQTDGTSVILTGTLTEVDTSRSDGVVFVEENVPFQIIADVGSDAFIFQFCLLPPFYVNVANGNLNVQTSGAASAAVAHVLSPGDVAGGCQGRTPMP